MSDADCTHGRESRSVAASSKFFHTENLHVWVQRL